MIMDRRSGVKNLLALGDCCSAIPAFGMNTGALPPISESLQDDPDDEIARLKR